MRCFQTLNKPGAPFCAIAWLAYALLALLTAAAPTLAQTAEQNSLIQALFGDLPATDDLDANHDGTLTVADILLLGPENPATPTPTPTATETFTPTPSPTETGTLFSGTISEFVPHAVGDQLVYRVTDPLGRITTETTLVTSSDASGAFVVDDLELSGQTTRKHETQLYTDMLDQLLFSGGTDVLRDLSTICTPPLLRLTMPVVAGKMFSTTVRCEVRIVSRNLFVGFIDRTDAFTPIEVLDRFSVLAGTYSQVVHIHGTTNLSGDLESNEIYIAPGVGAILQLSTAGGQTTRRELTGGTIGGQPVGQ